MIHRNERTYERDAGLVTGSILVIDDDAALRRLIELSLADDGMMVETASNGAQAIAIATRRTPAAVVLDYGLPDADAAALVNAIRSVCGRAVAVVLITAGDNLAGKARAVGAADYLRKPFDLDDLTRVVRALVHLP